MSDIPNLTFKECCEIIFSSGMSGADIARETGVPPYHVSRLRYGKARTITGMDRLRRFRALALGLAAENRRLLAGRKDD